MTRHCRLFILSAILFGAIVSSSSPVLAQHPTIGITCRHQAAPGQYGQYSQSGQNGQYGQYGGPSDNAPRSLAPPPRDSYAETQIRDTVGTKTLVMAESPNPGYGAKPWYGAPYAAAPTIGRAGPDAGPPPQPNTYSSNEIVDAGHRFFGKASEGLANVVEYAFRKNGRPNGYILGEEASGAFVGGLRYGEGVLHTKGFGTQKIYWQGPSLGYDFGANGSKTLTLVYNLQYPSQIYERFAGVEGSAYFVGGVGITFQQHDDVILAPIRAGVGLRLGANVGYLKYTLRRLEILSRAGCAKKRGFAEEAGRRV